MKKGDKKGLSTIIATLLIILLVIVSVVIVWSVIRNLIKDQSEGISFGKFTINLEIISVKQNPPEGEVDIKVRRNPGEGEINGVIFAIFDGEDTHIREVKNISLKELEVKTFTIDYNGTIVSVSIYPLFLTDSGKSETGNLADNYYYGGGSGGNGDGSGDGGGTCIPDCENKNCGDDGCEGICGICPQDESCSNGFCCPDGYYGYQGTCHPICTPDCTGKECGTSCGTSCGYGDCSILGPNNFCNESYMCEECIPDCFGRNCGNNGCGGSCGECIEPEECNMIIGICQECTPDCGTRECGPVPNGCGEFCGECEAFEVCINEECLPDLLNTGMVTSVWPFPVGRNYLTGSNLPEYGEPCGLGDANYIRITNPSRCYQILKLECPVSGGQLTTIQVTTGITNIEVDDNYELWRTNNNC